MSFNSMNPTKPPTISKPEGSLKIVVLNGSRQVDKVIDGAWTTQKVLSENGLPKGIYQLSEATKPLPSKEQSNYSGQVLHVDTQYLYQLSLDKQILKFDKHQISNAISPGEKLNVGTHIVVSTQNGNVQAVHKGFASNHTDQTPETKPTLEPAPVPRTSRPKM